MDELFANEAGRQFEVLQAFSHYNISMVQFLRKAVQHTAI